MPGDDVRDVILGAVEASLEAQLRAVRRLRPAGNRANLTKGR